MKIFKRLNESRKEITSYSSNNSYYTSILKNLNPSSIGYIQIESNGNIGRHEAPSDQLFLVISGQGWVTGDEDIRHEIKQGEAAFWKSGELHESGSETGITVIVIEGKEIEPLLKEMKWRVW